MTNLLGNTRRPDISFFRNGRIDITSRVSKMLEIANGDVIDMAVEQGEYYLFVRHKGGTLVGRHEAQCRPTSSSGGTCRNFRCYSKRLCDIVLRINGDVPVVRLPVGQPVHAPGIGHALPVIIRNNITKDIH